jgi:hypothetical protein
MTLIRLLRYAPEAATGLCATCTWGTVRKGFRENEAERGSRVHRLLRPPRPDDLERSSPLWLRHRDPPGCRRDSLCIRGLAQTTETKSPAAG